MLLGTCRGLNWPFSLLMSRLVTLVKVGSLNIRHFEVTMGDNGGQRSKEAGSTPLSTRATATGKSQYAVGQVAGGGSRAELANGSGGRAAPSLEHSLKGFEKFL